MKMILLSLALVSPVFGGPVDLNNGCMLYWFMPGCPLAGVFGSLMGNVYNWEKLCQTYTDNIELQNHQNCAAYKVDPLLSALEDEISNMILDQPYLPAPPAVSAPPTVHTVSRFSLAAPPASDTYSLSRPREDLGKFFISRTRRANSREYTAEEVARAKELRCRDKDFASKHNFCTQKKETGEKSSKKMGRY